MALEITETRNGVTVTVTLSDAGELEREARKAGQFADMPPWAKRIAPEVAERVEVEPEA